MTASGAIDEPIREDRFDLGLILKGTVKKIGFQANKTNEEGSTVGVKVSENFVTEVYGLDLNTLTFYKYA